MTDAALMAQMMAMMQAAQCAQGAQGVKGALGATPGASRDQMAGMQGAMAQLQQTLGQPLSRAETIAVFKELADLGVLTPAMLAEARDCIMQAPPGAGDSIGMAAAVMKAMLLPQLAEAKARLGTLSPEEQADLAGLLIDELRNAPDADRRLFLEGYGRGFYPGAIVDRVRSRL